MIEARKRHRAGGSGAEQTLGLKEQEGQGLNLVPGTGDPVPPRAQGCPWRQPGLCWAMPRGRTVVSRCPASPRLQGHSPSATRTTGLLTDLAAAGNCYGQGDQELRHLQAASKLLGKDPLGRQERGLLFPHHPNLLSSTQPSLVCSFTTGPGLPSLAPPAAFLSHGNSAQASSAMK